MALTIPRAAYMASRRRPIRGNLLVRGGVIGVGTLRPRHGKVALKAGTRIRVISDAVADSQEGKFAALAIFGLGPKSKQNGAFVSIPLTDGSEVVFRVDGISAPVLAAKLRAELAPLGAEVTVR
jgi:hypothetical protein